MYVSAASGPIQPEGQYCKSDMSSQPISDISEIFYLYINTLMVSMFTSEWLWKLLKGYLIFLVWFYYRWRTAEIEIVELYFVLNIYGVDLTHAYGDKM
jgi:hypothetical protein